MNGDASPMGNVTSDIHKHGALDASRDNEISVCLSSGLFPMVRKFIYRRDSLGVSGMPKKD